MKTEMEKYHSGEKALTIHQVQTLFQHITNLQDLALLKLTIAAGLRRSDIIGVKKADINFSNSTVTFYEHKKSRTRTVPLPPDCIITLRRWDHVNKSKWLFPSKYEANGCISSRTAYNILRKYTKAAGIPDVPFHALRATCVKLCQKKGWTIEQTAKLIGDRVTTVQKHYSVPSDEELREVAQEKAIL